MDFSQIRPVALFLAAFLNGLFAFLLWSRKGNKNAYYLGWLAFWSAIVGLTWAGVFSFPNKLFWIKMTWLTIFLGPSHMMFVYYFTGQIKFFRLKMIFWYSSSFAVFSLALLTPYIIYQVSNQYPFIITQTAGPLNQAARIIPLTMAAIAFYYLVNFYRRTSSPQKLQLKYFITGFLIYMAGTVFFNGFLPLLYYEQFFSYLDAPVYFSIIWIGLATYAITKKDLFNLKIIITEMLVGLLSLILFAQIFFVEGLKTKITAAVIFSLFCLIGYRLIKATHQEIKKEQEAKKLAQELNNLNKTLEKKVQEKTYELQASVNELEKSKKALLNILDDIDEARRKIEEEKNKTLAIIANFADGLLVFDDKNFLILMNPQAESFFGLKTEMVIGKASTELKQFPSFAALFETLKNQPIFRKEMAWQDLTLEVSSIPVKSPGEKIGDLIILHNVTREKLIEKMKTEFVSVAAHKLRTPLSGVKWALSLLLEGDIGKLNEEQKKFLQKSYDSNERMLILINDLLDVARIEEGKYIYNITPVKIEDLAQKAINNYKELAKRRKIKVIYQAPITVWPEIKVDAEKITIAMQNLIENAIKYTPPGGQVTIELKNDTTKIEFSVKDTGVGIAKNQQDRLFTKFFRAANVMLMETDGTGLGLFITKNIVEAHHGRIWFASQEGQGSTFSFSLPIK